MLNRIIHFSINNKFIIGLMTLFLIIWGVWSASKLPIDAVPDITNNQVQIITLCPTLAGQEVEQLVTFPIEQSIANLPDLEETRSISRFGLSVITVVFDDDVNIYFARQLISERLKEATDQIPQGIGTPELGPVSTGLGEVYQYILHPKKGSEKKYSAMDLRSMQDWIVARQLNGTPGIAEINSFGGKLKQYEVGVNPNRLKAMGVTIPDIFNALEKKHIDLIIEIELKKLFARVAELGYQLNLSDKAKAFIAEKGFDKQFGARPLKRAIQKYVEDSLAEEIITSKIGSGDEIFMDIEEGSQELTVEVHKAEEPTNQ